MKAMNGYQLTRWLATASATAATAGVLAPAT
jgi:hypothetical protein